MGRARLPPSLRAQRSSGIQYPTSLRLTQVGGGPLLGLEVGAVRQDGLYRPLHVARFLSGAVNTPDLGKHQQSDGQVW